MNISQLGLNKLRTALTIIPQDPVLFGGTLRFNLDPFEQHNDTQLWKTLEIAHLKAFVTTLPGGLDYPIRFGYFLQQLALHTFIHFFGVEPNILNGTGCFTKGLSKF